MTEKFQESQKASFLKRGALFLRAAVYVKVEKNWKNIKMRKQEIKEEYKRKKKILYILTRMKRVAENHVIQ